jgi:hypothetical protein
MSDQRDRGDGGIGAWLSGPVGARAVWWLAGACGLLLLADLVIHKHGPFAVEHLFGFYGWIGLGACVVTIALAGAIRSVLTRPEDYYDR